MGKIEAGMSIRTLLKFFNQIFCKLVLHFKVIIKNVIKADDIHSLSHLARLPDCESDGEAGDEDDTTGVVIIFIVVPQDDTEDLEDVKWIQDLKEIWIN